MTAKNITNAVHTLAAPIEKTLLKASRNRRAYIGWPVVTLYDIVRYLVTSKNVNGNSNILVSNLPSALEEFAARYINMKSVTDVKRKTPSFRSEI